MSPVQVPPAPSNGGDVAFVPPPGWTPPPGFDPRRGHPVDPTWPPAPEGWVFWAPVPQPRGLGALVRRGWWGPAVLVAVLGLVITMVVLSAGSVSPSDGLGSCWAEGSGQQMTAVDCDDSRARYVVTNVTQDPSQCQGAEGYLEPDGSQSRYECLGLKP